jgi:hypothetical protein
MKGDEITAGRWQRDVKEKYNYMQQRTEGGGTRTFKYAHAQCSEVMDVETG